MLQPIISADSHIIEPDNTYVDYIDPKFRERAPRLENDEKLGEIFNLEGIGPIALPIIAGAGRDPREIRARRSDFNDVPRGGWDPKHRIAAQDKDGIAAEVIYPSLGMVICAMPDGNLRRALMQAYNRWITDYCSENPTRMIGLGQSAGINPETAVQDLHEIKALGLRGVMMPGQPMGDADYDDPAWDRFWAAAVELELPVSFHVLTDNQAMGAVNAKARGGKINAFLGIIRACQDIMGMLCFHGVFERHPKLKVVCVEADAGWVPHYMYRMDHSYKQLRYLLRAKELQRLPSEYFHDHIYVTFQDDHVAFQVKDLCNVRRLMWANDYPHNDSTWPWSQDILARHTAHLTEEERNLIVHDNVAELYQLGI